MRYADKNVFGGKGKEMGTPMEASISRKNRHVEGFEDNCSILSSRDQSKKERVTRRDVTHADDLIVLYCIVFKYLYSAPQQPKANRGACGSISSKKRDKLERKRSILAK